jgi:tetratricopeptide (TPR) repeat protein
MTQAMETQELELDVGAFGLLAEADSYCRQALDLLSQRRWNEAAALGRQAVEIVDLAAARVNRRDADVVLVEALAVWGNALRRHGRSREAEPLLRRALTVAGAYPREPLRIAAACNDFGLLSQSTGNLLEAEHLFRRALAIVGGAGEAGGAMAATLYRNLAGLEHARGHYERGLAPARKACQIRARIAGPDHPEMIADRMTLASLHDGLGNYAESRAIYLEALDVLERIHGPEHFDIAACLGRLAALERAEGRLDESAGLYRRALAMEERLLGAVHPDTIATVGKIALVAQDRSRATQAHRSISRALEKVGVCWDCTGMEDCCRS